MPRRERHDVAMGLRTCDHIQNVRAHRPKQFLRILKVPRHVKAVGKRFCLISIYVAKRDAFNV